MCLYLSTQDMFRNHQETSYMIAEVLDEVKKSSTTPLAGHFTTQSREHPSSTVASRADVVRAGSLFFRMDFDVDIRISPFFSWNMDGGIAANL